MTPHIEKFPNGKYYLDDGTSNSVEVLTLETLQEHIEELYHELSIAIEVMDVMKEGNL